MGQKVNPVGFRTGIMVGWKSRWYASKQEFANLLIEDQKVRNFIKNHPQKTQYRSAGIDRIEIERTRDEVKVILFVARPGLIIGKKGQEVEAVVLAVDVERERISLGIKQLDADPFTTFVSINDKGAVVSGKVKSVDAKGAEIDLGEDIVGYLRVSEISADRVEDARNVLKEGDEISAVVTNVDRKTRNIQLSIKAKDAADQQEAMASLNQQASRENAGTTSLGALLRAKLDNTGN